MASVGITGANFKKIDKLTLSGGAGGEFPLTSVTITWGLDRPTTCTVAPVVGTRLLPQGGARAKGVTLESLPADVAAFVDMVVDGENYPLHTGYPVGNTLNSVSGSMPNSSMISRNISINSSLSLLAAINPASRLFFKGVVVETSKKSASDVAVIQSDKSIQSYFYPDQKKTIANPPKYIINLLNDLNESHKAAGNQTAPVGVKDILVTGPDYTINDAISAGGEVDITLSMAMAVAKRAVATWHGSNSYQALMDFNSLAFLHTVPYVMDFGGGDVDISTAQYLVAPTLPLYKKTARTIKNKELVAVTATDMDVEGLEPISQVWVGRTVGGSDDASTPPPTVGSIASFLYHQWPRGVTKGQALIKAPPPFFSAILGQKLVDGDTGNKPKKVNQKAKKGEETENLVKASEKKKFDRPQPDIDTLGEQVARMYYVDRAFNQRNVTITVPWHLYVEMVTLIGKNIAFRIPFESGNYIGHLIAVTLQVDRASNRANCQLTVAYVRPEKENNELGFDEHPFYNNFLGG